MRTGLKKQEKGFTIVEVMIVLGIAGLIMLIVFLAVPALQRSQRNSSRKSDAARVGAVANEWLSNRNGVAPVTADEANFRTAVGTLSQYDAAQLTITSTAGSTGSDTSIKLVTNATCNASNTASAAGTSRQMVVVYGQETSGTAQSVCLSV